MKDRKLLLLLALIVAFSASRVQAQTQTVTPTLVIDPESGLEYLRDGEDGELYIYVGGNAMTELPTINGISSHTYFISDPALRPALRGAFNSNNGKFYKSALDAVTEIGGSSTTLRDQVENYKGLEYFRNLTTLTVKSEGVSSVTLDLSKNTKLSSLSFTNNGTNQKLSYLDISNTKLTSVIIPSGGASYLTTFKCDNTHLTGTVDLRSFTKLSTLSYENSGLVLGTTLLIPSQYYTNQTELTIDVTDDESKAVDASLYTKLERLTVIGATSLTLPTTTKSTFTLDVSESQDLSSVDFTPMTNLNNLTVIGAQGMTLPNKYTFTLDVTESPEIASAVDLSSMTSLNNLTIKGATGLTLPSGRTTFTINSLESPNLDIDMRNQTSLQSLTCKCANLLKLYTENTALTYLDVSKSELKNLDLSNGEAPNLVTVYCHEAPIVNLKLPNHTALTSLRIAPDNNNSRFYNSKNALKVIDVTGCTALTSLSVTGLNLGGSNWTYERTVVEELYASGCSELETIECQNGLLHTMAVENCPKLKKISVSQNYLTTVDLTGCSGLKIFIAHRNKFTNLNFLLRTVTEGEGGTRASVENINQLEQIQVNGGSYVVIDRQEDGTDVPIIREKFTNVITDINTEHLHADHMRLLLCADNLLQTLDISHLTKLTYLQCENNMLLTLDLSSLPTGPVTHSDNVTRTLNSESQWGYKYGQAQVGFLDTEIVKGNAVDGSHDLIAIHLPNGGYSYTMDGTSHPDDKAYLWDNVTDARTYLRYLTTKDEQYNNIANSLDNEPGIRMQKIEDIATQDGVNPYGHTGEHLIIHSVSEILAAYAAGRRPLDQDLYDKILTYRYNTIPDITGNEDKRNNGISAGNGTDAERLSPYIFIRAHIYPYIMYVNPATKASEGNQTGADYYSGTIYLDYDAVIPEGVTVWKATGIEDREMIMGNGENTIEQQLKLVHIGGGKNSNNEDMPIILPANTPVYVKSETAAGLYAFEKAWDFTYYGWEDYRNDRAAIAAAMGKPDIELMPLLHGVDEGDTKAYKEQYDPTTYPGKWITASALEGNILQASTEATPVTPKSVLTLGRERVLGTNKIGFWQYLGNSVPAHRCYIDASLLNSSNRAKGVSFLFDQEFVVDGIQQVSATNAIPVDNAWYTLQGIRLDSQPMTHGIYIHNGRKVVVK
ncbi:MAG: hypothetical protein J6N73_08315 [Prevotella sp.]|nr:hypothetical protein [Prevotella sp.]